MELQITRLACLDTSLMVRVKIHRAVAFCI
jgi:hypothetical protein